jgi:N-acetylated-alpha-linked acidic dipeptidase
MVNEKSNKYENLPIPTYEEATSSRPTSAQSHLGVGEASSDAERQGLLGRIDNETRPWRSGISGYQPPTVESARSSLESDYFLPSSADVSSRGSDEAFRREMAEMEVLDPSTDGAVGSSRIRNQLSKRITSLTNTLSSIHLPFEFRFPSFNFIRSRLPENRMVVWANIARFIALIFVLLLVYTLFVSDIFPVGRSGAGRPYGSEEVRAFVQGFVDENRIRDYLEHLTAYDHVAGTEGDYILAKWVEELFAAAQLEQVELKEYVEPFPVTRHTLFHLQMAFPWNSTERARQVSKVFAAFAIRASIG